MPSVKLIHNAAHGGPVSRDIVLGVLSLILWSLIVVVTIKYVLLLLRADNNGEGGTLSLMALRSARAWSAKLASFSRWVLSEARCSSATP